MISFELNSECETPFTLITISIKLTKVGMKNFKKVIAVVLEFFRIVREEWLEGGQSIDLFNEC